MSHYQTPTATGPVYANPHAPKARLVKPPHTAVASLDSPVFPHAHTTPAIPTLATVEDFVRLTAIVHTLHTKGAQVASVCLEVPQGKAPVAISVQAYPHGLAQLA